MLRKQGLTQDQLKEEFEKEIKKPYEDQNIISLFGKPPYEFLGQVDNRDYPNYSDFDPQYIDQLGRQYQYTDSPDKFFIRIPISITRKRTINSKYEDYIGFPNPGDDIHLSNMFEEIHARVSTCPFDFKRAVSNIYLENILRISFIPDFIDKKGRLYMRCIRNNCFLSDIPHKSEEQEQLYYVKLPSNILNDIQENDKKRKRGTNGKRTNIDTIINHFIENTMPYHEELEFGYQIIPKTHSTKDKEKESIVKKHLTVKGPKRISFPKNGTVLECLEIHKNRRFKLIVKNDSMIEKNQSLCCSGILSLASFNNKSFS